MGTFSFPQPGGGMNMNPTGIMGGNTTSGGAPYFPGAPTGGSGNYGYGNMNPSAGQPVTGQPIQGRGPGLQQPQLYSSQAPAGSAPSMNPGGAPPTGTQTGENGQTSSTSNPYGLTQEQANRALGENQNYFGEGVGAELQNYLNSEGGYNSALTQQAVDSQTNAMQNQIQLGANNLTSQLGAMGISGGSSSQGAALSNYYSQASAQENAITSQDYQQMWEQSQQRQEQMLQFVGQVNATGTANQSTWQDYLGDALQVAGTAAMFA
jgi:hypothetical protein